MHRWNASNQSILLHDGLSDVGSTCVLFSSTNSCNYNLDRSTNEPNGTVTGDLGQAFVEEIGRGRVTCFITHSCVSSDDKIRDGKPSHW
jgi:hypothetical protein